MSLQTDYKRLTMQHTQLNNTKYAKRKHTHRERERERERDSQNG